MGPCPLSHESSVFNRLYRRKQHLNRLISLSMMGKGAQSQHPLPEPGPSRAFAGPREKPELGAWLFLIAPKGRDLLSQTLGTLHITAGECNGKSKFQLFQPVFTLLARETGCGRSGVRCCRKGSGTMAGSRTASSALPARANGLLETVLRRRKGHGWLSDHSDTVAKGLGNPRFKQHRPRGKGSTPTGCGSPSAAVPRC